MVFCQPILLDWAPVASASRTDVSACYRDMMEDVSRLVGQLYEGHPYPPPVSDIATASEQGVFIGTDPSLWAPMFWPEGRPRRPLKILSAGCGTQQAAWLAYRNRDCEIFGVDLSEASLAHERYLQEKHELTNLHLFRGDLREAGKIGRGFDMVACTGVLHHMRNPDEGMRALTATLAQGGVFVGMVYAAPSRTGVYMMQDVFRRLDVQPDKDGIAFARRALASMPRWHFVQHYGASGAELHHDAAFVDTYLHPQDRAYTVPQILELIEQNDLSFQGWYENNAYYPEGSDWLSDELRAQISALPEREQWATMEMIGISKLSHFFIARKGAAYPFAFDQRWRQFVPHRRRGLKRIGAMEYKRLGKTFALPPEEADLLNRADGERALGELQDAAPGADVRGLFERFWKQGHVMVELGQT